MRDEQPPEPMPRPTGEFTEAEMIEYEQYRIEENKKAMGDVKVHGSNEVGFV